MVETLAKLSASGCFTWLNESYLAGAFHVIVCFFRLCVHSVVVKQPSTSHAG